jgi:hypothetical protein
MWAWVLLWPVVERAVLLADDVALLFAHLNPPEAFHPWDSWVYRPIEGLSSRLIDPVTRASCRWRSCTRQVSTKAPGSAATRS